MERQFSVLPAISTIGIEDMAPKDIISKDMISEDMISKDVISKDMTSKDVASNRPGFASCPHCCQPIRYALSVCYFSSFLACCCSVLFALCYFSL
jgi:hypothetical protein